MKHILIKPEWRVKYTYKGEWCFSDRTCKTRKDARKLQQFYGWAQEAKVVRVMAQEW